MPIYLDYNASTPIRPEVAAEMRPFLERSFGNPSSGHWAGRPARAAVDLARERVAGLLACDPAEIVFTSGGTEASNHAIQGSFFAARRRGLEQPHFVSTAVEHPATLEPLRFVESLGARVTILPVDRTGRVDPAEVGRAIGPQTILVTVMHANNETGTLMPVEEISRIARERGVPLHLDAAQTVGKIATRVDDLGADLLSVAGHKFYGPKGVGALFLRRGVDLEPLIRGAGHESGRRAGTENVLLVAGLGKACEIAATDLGMPRIKELRNRFEADLLGRYPGSITLNGHSELRLPNTSSLNFVGRIGADVLALLGDVAASTGSACHSGSVALSPVLREMGVPPEEGMGAVRFSLGRPTTEAEISEVLARLHGILG
jgi:cysteine desulfurase